MQLRLLCPQDLGAAQEIDFGVCRCNLIDRVAAFLSCATRLARCIWPAGPVRHVAQHVAFGEQI
jgi:hypothetical protein